MMSWIEMLCPGMLNTDIRRAENMANENNYCVYIHTNKENGKLYVGQTCKKPEVRWSNGDGYKGCYRFYNAIQTYGWDGFRHEVVAEKLTKAEADDLEKFLIEIFDLQNPRNGYNIAAGGGGLGQGEKHPMWGEHFSKDIRRKRSTEQRTRIGRPVLCVETGTVYNSLVEAAEANRLLGADIGNCCRGKLKTTGGFHWKFA